MIEMIKELPDNVVGIIARGRVTNEECDNVLRPAMERCLKLHGKLRLYYEIGSRFPGAGWDDLDVAIDHLPQWERIAVVTDTGWVRHTVNALRFLLASEVRVFTTFEAAEGRSWIAGTDPALSTDAVLASGRGRVLQRNAVSHHRSRRSRRSANRQGNKSRRPRFSS